MLIKPWYLSVSRCKSVLPSTSTDTKGHWRRTGGVGGVKTPPNFERGGLHTRKTPPNFETSMKKNGLTFF